MPSFRTASYREYTNRRLRRRPVNSWAILNEGGSTLNKWRRVAGRVDVEDDRVVVEGHLQAVQGPQQVAGRVVAVGEPAEGVQRLRCEDHRMSRRAAGTVNGPGRPVTGAPAARPGQGGVYLNHVPAGHPRHVGQKHSHVGGAQAPPHRFRRPPQGPALPAGIIRVVDQDQAWGLGHGGPDAVGVVAGDHHHQRRRRGQRRPYGPGDHGLAVDGHQLLGTAEPPGLARRQHHRRQGQAVGGFVMRGALSGPHPGHGAQLRISTSPKTAAPPMVSTGPGPGGFGARRSWTSPRIDAVLTTTCQSAGTTTSMSPNTATRSRYAPSGSRRVSRRSSAVSPNRVVAWARRKPADLTTDRKSVVQETGVRQGGGH